MEEKVDIYASWVRYTTKNEEKYFRQFIRGFVTIWESQLNLNWKEEGKLPDSSYVKPDAGPHLSRLPEELLPAIGKFLYIVKDKIEEKSLDLHEMTEAKLLIKTLIMISRNFSNIPSVAASEYVRLIIFITSKIVNYIIDKNDHLIPEDRNEAVEFCLYSCHLLECLYDPYLTWRFFKTRKHISSVYAQIHELSLSSAVLHPEVVPFIYEIFEKKVYQCCPELSATLLDVLGAAISGSRDNALSGICPATASLLVTVISDTAIDFHTKVQAVYCFVLMIYTLLSTKSHQRQIEITTLIEVYKGALANTVESSEDSEGADMLETMIGVLAILVDVSQGYASLLRAIFVQNYILETILDIMEKILAEENLTYTCIKTLSVLIKSEPFAKERMMKIDAYDRIFRKFRLMDNFNRKLLIVLVEMAVEESYDDFKSYQLQNCKLVVPLLSLLPGLDPDNQIWLATILLSICTCNLQCKWKASKCSTLEAVCRCLLKYECLDSCTIHRLIELMQNLASITISTLELKGILSICKRDEKLVPHFKRIIAALTNVSRIGNAVCCRNYFDIQSNADGLCVQDIHKWPGPLYEFSFHCWFRLSRINCADVVKVSTISSFRRQLLTLLTPSKLGLEMFVSSENTLLILIHGKKEFLAVSSDQFAFGENQWYCLDVTFVPSKRPFAQNQVCVYIDGALKSTANPKFSPIAEALKWCHIGSPLEDATFEAISHSNAELSDRSILPNFISQVPNYLTLSLRGSNSFNPNVKSFPCGMQTIIYGPSVAMYGQLGAVCAFQEALSAQQVLALFKSGVNCQALFNEDNSDSLHSRLIFFYTASACAFDKVTDLSKHKMDGRIKAVVCDKQPLQDVISSVGEANVLLPLLECDEFMDDSILNFKSDTEDNEDFNELTILYFENYLLDRMEDNPIAATIILLDNILKKNVNKEMFLKRHGFSISGMLLSKASPNLLDLSVLSAVYALAKSSESLTPGPYQKSLYQHLLLNFEIWSRCVFKVRYGHVQLVSAVVKNNRKYFRKHFGVQFFLDAVRRHTTGEKLRTTVDEVKCLRDVLLDIVKYYIQRDVSVYDTNAIVNFLIVEEDEAANVELLELLIDHLESKLCKDQIYLLLYEEHSAELLYTLMTKTNFSMNIKQKVLKLISVLLRSKRVYERNKSRLRLMDHALSVGLYPGLISLMPESHELSMEVALMFLDQILLYESSASYAGALYLLQRLYLADLDIKLEAARKVLAIIFMKPNASKLFAKQIGWPDCVAKLLVKRLISPPESPTIDLQEPEEVVKLEVSENKSFNYILGDAASLLENDFRDVAGQVSSLLTDNIYYAADNLGAVAENVSSVMAENIQYAADNLNYAAGNITSAISSVADNVQYYAKENLSSAVSSAYSLISGQKSITDEISPKRSDTPHSLSNRSTSSSFEDLCLTNRRSSSQSSMSKDAFSLASANLDSISNDNVNVDQDDEQIIFDMLQQWKDLEAERIEDKEGELCHVITNILFTVMWRGYDNGDKSVWKERGQIMAAINMLGLNNVLYCSHLELKLQLLEMMAQAALTDLSDVTNVENGLNRAENTAKLLRLVYDLVVLDPNPDDSKKSSVKLLDGVIALSDALYIFKENVATECSELTKITFGILLKCAESSNTDLCALACAKLMAIAQTRETLNFDESAYIFYVLNKAVRYDLNSRIGKHYSLLVPIANVFALKLTDCLNLEHFIPDYSLPGRDERFFNNFKTLCLENRWLEFLEEKVKPMHDNYENELVTKVNESMNIFWAECYEAHKSALVRRAKNIAESRIRFQNAVVIPFMTRQDDERNRYNNVWNQQRNHKILLKKKWRLLKNFYTGPRGVWKNRETKEYWRLSQRENFSRMRLKLVPNLNFDPHSEASNLRDNAGCAKSRQSRDICDLNISQMALKTESSTDQISEEDLAAIAFDDMQSENKTDNQGKEKLYVTCDCELVTLMSIIKGRMDVTSEHFYFFDLSPIKEDADRQDFKWSLSKLREIYLRRYNLRKTALEFFLTDQTNYFLNFDKKVRNKVFATILRLRPANLSYHSHKTPADLLQSSGITQKWVNREITNFDYLMQLNTIAGRTYNDLSQYPVFPWILADYESEELDLTNPAAFRDLSRPMGVVNAENEAEVRNKYNAFEDPYGVIAKFHYGTHYSNSAGVLHYMVRVEPFTTLHIDLQSGRFDVADRQFHSILQTWKLLMDNPNDVKELIPEFFYFPEFLKNLNEFHLGVLQGTQEKVGDVVLPKWATSAEDFIYKHRKALECEYVSSHLHEWIDLIFGYKQRGAAAVEALNVFYYCSYEGAVDLDQIEDPVEREAVEGMINNFGQTPSQLMKEPHPPRLTLHNALWKMMRTDFKKPDFTLFFDQLSHFQIEMASDKDPLVFVSCPRVGSKGFLMSAADSLVTVSKSGLIGMHSWTSHDRYSPKGFSLEVDQSVNNPKHCRDIGGTFYPGMNLHDKLFVVSQDCKFLLSAGHWDCSIKVYSFHKNKIIASALRHTGIVTCLMADNCGWYVISGSKDCTAIVWDISAVGSVNSPSPKPYQVLCGHDKPVTCVALATELDMAISGSMDGTVNVYTIHEGQLIRTLHPVGCIQPVFDVKFVVISNQGNVAFSATDQVNHSVHVYSVNGENLGSKYVLGQVTGLVTVNDCIVVADDAGDLTISRILGLHPVYSIPLHVPVQTVVSTCGNTHLLVPLRDGHMVVLGLPNS